MSRNVKVACAQLGPIHLADNRRSVVERLLAMLREAHAGGCKLVVFPELALTTFFPRYWMKDEEEIDSFFEREMPNESTQPLFETAAKLGVGFCLGYAELAEEDGMKRHYNTCILVGPDGRIIGKYRKVHLPGHAEHLPETPFQHLEKKYFEIGNLGFQVWNTPYNSWANGIMGMCICNDRRWPETYRVMGLQGVEMVMLGYNLPTDNIHWDEPAHLRSFHNRLSMQSGAYQNGTWVIGAAKGGKEDGFGLIAESCIVAPTGEIVALAATAEDEVLQYTCDLDLGNNIKQHIFNFEKHRRIEHYQLITERTGAILPPESN